MTADERIIQILTNEAKRLRTSVRLMEDGKKTTAEDKKDTTPQSILAEKHALMEHEALIGEINARRPSS